MEKSITLKQISDNLENFLKFQNLLMGKLLQLQATTIMEKKNLN